MKFDLHMHTTRHSPDSDMDPFVMCRQAREIGLDGVVITEHDWLWTEPELAELRRGASESGSSWRASRVSAFEGHFYLAYGGGPNLFAAPMGVPRGGVCAARSTPRAAPWWRRTRSAGTSRSRRSWRVSGRRWTAWS